MTPDLHARRPVTPEPSEYHGDPDEWDRFVRERTGWTHFHLHGWKAVIEEVFGHDCTYLSVQDASGELEGVLPLVRVKSLVFGDYLVSMPFLNYGGPLGSDRAVQALSSRAVEIAEEAGVDLLELRSRGEQPISLPASHRKITVLLDLPERDPEVLWDDFDGKVRNQVRRPRKEGVTVEFGHDQIDGFYEVFSTHMRNLGTPVLPVALFETLRDRFPDSVAFGCAYLDGKPLACGCGFEWADEFEMTWASDLIEYRKIAPNMLLYWAFIERSIERGLSVFNFGRCTPGSGTHRFKKQWGTRDQQLWWYQHPPDADRSTPSPDEGLYALGVEAWRRVPLPVANALGPHLVKYIP